MIENWKPIVGYEGLYEVSDLGRVKALPRRVNWRDGHTRLLPERIRVTPVGNHGYLQVGLTLDGYLRTHLVHYLVARAFHGPSPGDIGAFSGGWQVNHIDGDKLNPSATNLEWVTREENESHAVDQRLVKGSRLTEADWVNIQADRALGMSYADLGRKYNYARGSIWNLFNTPANRRFITEETPPSEESGVPSFTLPSD